ncbi:Toxin higB-1 [Moraxella lacunata]|uniref:Toxin higB-1 n=1 Tax=Moraxella lacunata TaxID=477 RepID=A0A378T7U5_MORLA|nr:type II toxin-antitoxin system RelE/ParE family toxin [Moraxella lacunata]STZ55606.1 Toxin higB-1 [Moraxella lacunata]
MIQSFKCKDTQSLFETGSSRVFANFLSVATRKLTMLDNAVALADLRIPPANRLEKLTGDREGQYSIRINDQFRICFVWGDDGVYDVEIVDYH